MTGVQTCALPILVTDMLKMRYANYPKDYFMGILPSSQYGSVAVLPGTNNPQYGGSSLVVDGGSAPRLINSSGTSVLLRLLVLLMRLVVLRLIQTFPPFQFVLLNTYSAGKK